VRQLDQLAILALDHARGAVLADRQHPCALGPVDDLLADLGGQIKPNREVDVALARIVQKLVHRAGAIAAKQDRLGLHELTGQLPEPQLEDRNLL
jgi:hypothetical protein